MYYQRNSWRAGCNCGCSSANRNRNTGTWAKRNWDNCGYNNARNADRAGCGCNNARNVERAGCGCNNARNVERSGCGCNDTVAERILPEKRNCPYANQGTEWRNRSGCGTCTEARTTCDAPCNKGADDHGLLTGQSLAMVYSPYQHFQEVYDPREGLCNGTIFSDLDKPFCPKCGC